MDKELSYEFVRGYIQNYKDTCSRELIELSDADELVQSFVRGQFDAAKSILANMELWK